ncbi:catalase A [Diaporthe australafricana]|uniref:Catalase n=1 Tax=Diaporthe australafricana TaxID=127596 RepID=A0ABR3VYH8_9PEZI
MDGSADPAAIHARQAQSTPPGGNAEFLDQFSVDDTGAFLTSDAGGPIEDQASLRAGARGPTVLEDFILRQKIMHFDHERVPERAVHARGAGAYGTFTSNGDWSNITSASFLNAQGKRTSTFVRFSTVAGSRGSADLARDVHGFATRFYTDEGNFDIVGNNVPVFFIQDAIQFPDLVHSVKPSPDNEIPQAATAHDSAWDFFSSQPSTLHTLMWAMSGFGIVRSYRHMDGFGVHTFRTVTDDGTSRLIKWHWKSKQGKASFLWEEAQVVNGKNADFHRLDLWNAIASGNGPEWDLAVQVVDESQAEAFGFDMLDPTKILPEELAPLQVLGRIFSYLDTQLNRHGNANFEQLPINRPRTRVNNNNRDGAGQNLLHKNIHHYTPSALSGGFPMQANATQGRGFVTAPQRQVGGNLVRELSPSFNDHWSQPRLFLNSLTPPEQQILVNAIRFETSNVKSPIVRQNIVTQLNRISNDLAVRVATALAIQPPAPDPTFYHDNKTTGLNIFGVPLPTIATLTVGILTTTTNPTSMQQATALQQRLSQSGVVCTIVGESLTQGIAATYSQSDASGFDGIIVAEGAEALFQPFLQNTLFPLGRPSQMLIDGYRWAKPVGALGTGSAALAMAGIPATPGVFTNVADVDTMAAQFEGGLRTFKFLDRFPLDNSTAQANDAPTAGNALLAQAVTAGGPRHVSGPAGVLASLVAVAMSTWVSLGA